MPSPQPTPHRDDLGHGASNACLQPVPPITTLSRPHLPSSIESRCPRRRANVEITNGREDCPRPTPHWSLPPLSSEILGAWICKMPQPPSPIELVVACLQSQAPSQAATAHHSGWRRAVSAMVWPYGLALLIAGNGSTFPSPGGRGGGSECHKSSAEFIHSSSPKAEGGRYRYPVPDAEGQSIPRQSRIEMRQVLTPPTPQCQDNHHDATSSHLRYAPRRWRRHVLAPAPSQTSKAIVSQYRHVSRDTHCLPLRHCLHITVLQPTTWQHL